MFDPEKFIRFGYLDARQLEDGRVIVLMPLFGGRLRICVDVDETSYRHAY